METLKWVGSVLLAIAIITIFLSVGTAIVLTGLVVSAIVTVSVVIGAVTLGIKKHLDTLKD